MPLDSCVVAVWVSQVVDAAPSPNPPTNPRGLKRTRNAQPCKTPGPKKRRALTPIENNMAQRTLRERKPTKGQLAVPQPSVPPMPVLSPTPSTANFLNNMSSPPFTTAASWTATDNTSHDSQPASQPSQPSDRTRGKRTAGRSTSPAKKLRGTILLDKPMVWSYPDKKTRAVLASHGLDPCWTELQTISRDVAIIPHAVRDVLERREYIMEHMVAAPPPQAEGVDDSDLSIFDVDIERIEFNALKGIVDTARRLSLDGSHESEWNTKVHEPLLAAALTLFAHSFRSANVTTAKPIREFAPSFKEDASDPKVVDFAICWKAAKDVRSRITRLLRAQDENLRTINQSLHIDMEPAPISIETKRGHNDEDDAKYKLAMWMAAWQNSIARFTPPGTRCVPLPGLLAFGHVWELYWMLDEQDEVFIVKAPWPLGDTQTVVGCYRLLSALRCLCRTWGEQLFLPWFRDKVLADG